MSIFRVSKDKNNPYVLLNKTFLHDPKISLKLKGFLAYCLSLPDDWKFHIRQLASVLKEGKDALYSTINEGIAEGYIDRDQQRKGSRFAGVEYIIHESKIQKKSTVSGNPDTESPDSETQTLLSNNPLNNDMKKKIRPNSKTQISGAKAPPPSAKASELSFFLLRKIKEMKPDLKNPHIQKWALTIDRMIRIDKRSPEKIEKIIEWLSSNEFWRVNILSPDKLRKQFDRLELQMDEGTSHGPQDRLTEVKAWLVSHPKKEVLVAAKKKNLVDWGETWMDFKGREDSHIKLEAPNAKERIDHWINKIETVSRSGIR